MDPIDWLLLKVFVVACFCLLLEYNLEKRYKQGYMHVGYTLVFAATMLLIRCIILLFGFGPK